MDEPEAKEPLAASSNRNNVTVPAVSDVKPVERSLSVQPAGLFVERGGSSYIAAQQRPQDSRFFSYTNRNTDVAEKFFVRVDVTEEFPFLVSKSSPYFER